MDIMKIDDSGKGKIRMQFTNIGIDIINNKTNIDLETANKAIKKCIKSKDFDANKMFEYAKSAKRRGIEVIIAGAGGAAHLPGMVASQTLLPVIGVPVKTSTLNGLDSLLSIVQMPGGIPVATVAINQAKNAALLAAQILAIHDEEIYNRLVEYRKNMTESVLEAKL